MKIIQKIKAIPAKVSARFLKRTERVLLEHLPEKHQRSVVAVYRAGFWLNITGIFWTVVGCMFIYFGIASPGQNGVVATLIPRVVFTLIMLGVAFLGGWVIRLKIRPSQIFGLSIAISLISLLITIGVTFIFVAANLTRLYEVYGDMEMVLIDSLLFMLVFFPVILLGEFGYYLFVAHKGYTLWHEQRYGKAAKLVKTTTKKDTKSAVEPDDNLL